MNEVIKTQTYGKHNLQPKIMENQLFRAIYFHFKTFIQMGDWFA